MILLLECIIICILMWIICFMNTGTEEKNLKNFQSYPLELQSMVKRDHLNDNLIRENSKTVVFISNIIMFGVIELIFGYFIKTDIFLNNFIALLILGEVLNIFDLVIIDLIWWRNSPRIRFNKYPDRQLYRNPQQHIQSFIRAIFMFLIVAIIDGWILILL